MRWSAAGLLGLLTLLSLPVRADDHQPGGPAIAGPLNTIKDVQGPAAADISSGMDITIVISFRRNGEIFGGRVTYQTPHVSDAERAVYAAALADTIKRCSPLPLSDSLGGAIAGRPFSFHFIDNRKQRKA